MCGSAGDHAPLLIKRPTTFRSRRWNQNSGAIETTRGTIEAAYGGNVRADESDRGNSVEGLDNKPLFRLLAQDPTLFPKTALGSLQRKVTIPLLVLGIEHRFTLAFIVIESEIVL